jgi:cell division protein FtsW
MLALVAGYRRARLFSFLDPWSDPTSSGYQLVQSLVALGSGGWTGVGMGASRQKWSFLPNAHTDFIFAIIGEELGLLGTLTVLVLFAAIAWSGLRIAARAPDLFGALVAVGITAWLVGQALANMGAVTGLLPVTGIPLPFVSFGSSQMLTALAGVGVLGSIGRAGRG